MVFFVFQHFTPMAFSTHKEECLFKAAVCLTRLLSWVYLVQLLIINIAVINNEVKPKNFHRWLLTTKSYTKFLKNNSGLLCVKLLMNLSHS